MTKRARKVPQPMVLPLLEGRGAVLFRNSIDKRGPNECWPWIGRLSVHGGYGVFSLRWKQYRAHRLAFMLANGLDPGALHVCHSCDNPPCCNPAHLWLGTNLDNTRDCNAKGRRPKGSQIWQSVLTEAQVAAILLDTRSLRQVALEYNVSAGAIGDIRRGDKWRHVAGKRHKPNALFRANLNPPLGEDRVQTKLTEEEVRAIRADPRTHQLIGDDYGVHANHVSAIKLRRTWKWLT